MDFISVYRELKNLNNPVGIFIEDLNLNTLDSSGETILVMFSTVAQAESEQKSEAIKWSIIERFKKGLPIILRIIYWDLKKIDLVVFKLTITKQKLLSLFTQIF